jgi:DNA polymerase-3 subunit epsilon
MILRDGAAALRRRVARHWRPRRRAQSLAGIDFVIVDVETTGWSPGDAQITEIGAIRLAGGGPGAEFSALVNPGQAIPADIAALTGISDDMVALAPPVAAVLPSFLDFTTGFVLAAHNAPFDVGFLASACAGSALTWPAFTVLDTAALARGVLGPDEVPNYKLSTLAAYFDVRALPSHRALADARATAEVLSALLARLAAAGGSTLADVLATARAGEAMARAAHDLAQAERPAA